MIICICHGVSDRQIHQAIREGACSLEEISRCNGAGSDCGSCIKKLRKMVDSQPIAERETHPAIEAPLRQASS